MGGPYDIAEAIAVSERLGQPLHFRGWLAVNWKVWEGFAKLADKMRARRPHYSARAVLHVLRWDHALAEKPDDPTASAPLFKINNNRSPMLAELYNELRGVDFFRRREHGDD